jgi:Putative DNA-binding domain
MDLHKLRNILHQGESQHTEFKSDFPEQAHDIAKSMVAFSNSGGGIILMGVDDNGNPIGIKNPSKVDERLANIAKGCSPQVWPKISRVNIASEITVVCAEISHSPICTYKGKVYIRVGATSREADGKQIEKLSEELNPQYIRLEADLDKAHRISKYELESKAWRGYLIGIIGILICFGVVFSLLLLISNIFLWICFIIALGATFFSFDYFLKHYSETMRLHIKRPRNTEEASFIGQGRLMKNDNEGGYLIYNPTAPCIYPCCNEGKIVISDAPPREVSRIGRTFIGVCSVAGKDHSYRLDYILVATPEQFDWRAPDTT